MADPDARLDATLDPTSTDGDCYRTIWENERVRVLEYADEPGHRTHRHRHPDSVMVALTSFRRRVSSGERSVDVELAAGDVRWVSAQEHLGENTGDRASHAIFVELKATAPADEAARPEALGPSAR